MVVDTHDGTVMQRTDYDEFGLIIDEDLAENWTPVLFGYAGGLQDRDTGLIRFGARDYDPMVGRWTSKEPLGFNGSDNFYSYCDGDPVNWVDVTGLFRTKDHDTAVEYAKKKLEEHLKGVDPNKNEYAVTIFQDKNTKEYFIKDDVVKGPDYDPAEDTISPVSVTVTDIDGNEAVDFFHSHTNCSDDSRGHDTRVAKNNGIRVWILLGKKWTAIYPEGKKLQHWEKKAGKMR
jgi:RHS repeat-associated protein